MPFSESGSKGSEESGFLLSFVLFGRRIEELGGNLGIGRKIDFPNQLKPIGVLHCCSLEVVVGVIIVMNYWQIAWRGNQSYVIF